MAGRSIPGPVKVCESVVRGNGREVPILVEGSRGVAKPSSVSYCPRVLKIGFNIFALSIFSVST